MIHTKKETPLYQTRSTRILSPARPRWRLVVFVVTVALLALGGRTLGNGLVPASSLGGITRPSSPNSKPNDSVMDALRNLSGVPARVPVPTTLPVQPAPPNQPAPAAPQQQVYNTGIGLIVREAPGIQAARIAKLSDGTTVAVIGPAMSSDGQVWKHVRTADGSEGWVSAEYLR